MEEHEDGWRWWQRMELVPLCWWKQSNNVQRILLILHLPSRSFRLLFCRIVQFSLPFSMVVFQHFFFISLSLSLSSFSFGSSPISPFSHFLNSQSNNNLSFILPIFPHTHFPISPLIHFPLHLFHGRSHWRRWTGGLGGVELCPASSEIPFLQPTASSWFRSEAFSAS